MIRGCSVRTELSFGWETEDVIAARFIHDGGTRRMAHPEPAGEEEEHHGSPWPVIIAVGMGVGYVGIVSASVPMLLVGVVIFGGGARGSARGSWAPGCSSRRKSCSSRRSSARPSPCA